MSRPMKAGLDYFPFNTAIFEDKRIRRLISRFGCDGFGLYTYIMARAYHENGYFLEYNDDFVEDAALDLNCSAEKIGLMLHYLLDKSLLDSKLFSTVKVLSSHGIQTQYQEIKKNLRRDIEVNGDLWILEESETEGFIKVRHSDSKSWINDSKSGINDSKSGINDTKESKVKESKVKESKENTTADKPPRRGVSRPKYRPEWFDRFWALYPRRTNRGEAVKAWDKLKPDLELCKVMAEAIRAQIRSEQWQDQQHIPHPSTWLRGERWNDELFAGNPTETPPTRKTGRLDVDENGEEVVRFD